MRKQQYHIQLTASEYQLLLQATLDFRNQVDHRGGPTEDLDCACKQSIDSVKIINYNENKIVEKTTHNIFDRFIRKGTGRQAMSWASKEFRDQRIIDEITIEK